MADEPRQDPAPETPPDESAAGPVADDAPSADAESPPSAPPAEEASEDAEAPAEGSSEAPAEDSPEADAPSADAESPPSAPPAEEASEDAEPAEQAPAEQAEQPAEPVDGEGEGEAGERSTPAESSAAPEAKKGDLPPGADLDPIALEPQAELSAEERARLEAEEEERASREAQLAAAADEPASRSPASMETGARYLATGKRKSSIARATVTPGDGVIVVNERTLEEYFPRPLHQTMARQPLATSGYEGTVDVRIRVHGGGISGQAGAVRHAIARALTEVDPDLRGDLKRRGFLTRDARVKERRKAGLKKARKRPQFSKR
jgi:small subunit ribosomal protein S9